MNEIISDILSKWTRHSPNFLRFVLHEFLTNEDYFVQGGFQSLIKFQEKRKTPFTA